ncbi:MAG: hypothetical protein KC646_11995 [Candidatus Cloacimonetes bacterium]|nr:hypothetical protein [Candidatus Cloacimonadota bacterium]
MFSIFIKNLNISLVIVCFVNNLAAIDFNVPQKVVGTFDTSLYLKKSTTDGYTLSHKIDKSGVFKYRWYLDKKVKQVKLDISFIGTLYVDLNGVSKLLDSSQWSTKNKNYVLNEETSQLDLEITFLAGQKAQVKSVELDEPTHDFDENYLYKNSRFSNIQKYKISLNNTEVPLGVNLEAEYLFRELSYLQQRKILVQLKKDGFNSIRLHKIFREYQKSGVNLLKKLQRFLSLCSNMNLIVYLDILSYPKVEQGVDGWKQSIFIDDVLQKKMEDWISVLSKLKVNNVDLFKWSKLHYVCLVNENSLYFEESKKSLDLFNNKLLAHRTFEWVSRNSFKQKLMADFYNKFSSLLRSKGFKKLIFLSNYQLGGDDLKLNQLLSKEVDRHLYLDYPIFYKGIVKVNNEDPMENLKKLKNHYLSISAKSGTFISEFNLPWPNRFQHTLIPILLYLNHLRPLKGIWFYDYRLRTDKFHSGGIFGIQRFRSIIGQLWYWKNLQGKDYSVSQEDSGLHFNFKDYKANVGSIFFKNAKFHYTAWKNCLNNTMDYFSFEKGSQDVFDSMGQIQVQTGGSPQELILPVELLEELQQELKCN